MTYQGARYSQLKHEYLRQLDERVEREAVENRNPSCTCHAPVRARRYFGRWACRLCDRLVR